MPELLAYSDFTKGYPHHRYNKLFYRASKEVKVRRNIFSISFTYRKSELGYNKVPHGSDIDVPMAMLSACSVYNDFLWLSAMLFISSEVA